MINLILIINLISFLLENVSLEIQDQEGPKALKVPIQSGIGISYYSQG